MQSEAREAPPALGPRILQQLSIPHVHPLDSTAAGAVAFSGAAATPQLAAGFRHAEGF